MISPCVLDAKSKPDENVVSISLPADALRQSLNALTPIFLQNDNKHVDGDITIESVDSLRMVKDVIEIQGVLGGRNLSVATNIAGQDIRLKLGEVRLPLACDVALRFDRAAKKIFLKPKFEKHDAGKKNDPAAAILPLLTALGDKEYPLDLATIQPFNARIGNRQIPIDMEPVKIHADNNILHLQLKPKVKIDRKSKATAQVPSAPPKKNKPTS